MPLRVYQSWVEFNPQNLDWPSPFPVWILEQRTKDGDTSPVRGKHQTTVTTVLTVSVWVVEHVTVMSFSELSTVYVVVTVSLSMSQLVSLTLVLRIWHETPFGDELTLVAHLPQSYRHVPCRCDVIVKMFHTFIKMRKVFMSYDLQIVKWSKSHIPPPHPHERKYYYFSIQSTLTVTTLYHWLMI
jgi:hypothetical protein